MKYVTAAGVKTVLPTERDRKSPSIYSPLCTVKVETRVSALRQTNSACLHW